MKGALGGKVVVVTGSTRGIGRAIAGACAAEGATVVVSSRTPAAVRETIDALTASETTVSGIACDVSSAADLKALFEHAVTTHGHIDAWVNNAGLSAGYRGLHDMSAEEVRGVVSVNLTGTMLACRLLVPYFRAHGGVLLNLSGRGHDGRVTPHTAAYAATKAAVTSLTKSIAAENSGYPISIHALIPGMVATDFYRDIVTSEEMAPSVQGAQLALEAFGVPLEVVGRETARILAQTPGRVTGKVYNLLKGRKLARGIALMTWYRMTGRMTPQE